MRWIQGRIESSRSHGEQGDLTLPAFAAIVFTALAAGATFRFWHIGRDPIWMDEAFTYFAASLDWRTLLFGGVDTHPPLFYAVQKLWLGIVPSLGMVRFPAALIGLANIAALAGLLAYIHSRRAGALGAVFLATSSFHIWMSRDARMYTLLLLALTFVLLATCALVMRRGNRGVWLAIYCLSAILTLYSQVIGAFMVAGCAIAWFLACVADTKRWTRLREFALANMIVAVAAVPMLFHVLGVAGVYPGAGSSDLFSVVWFVSNVIAYPGLPGTLELLTKLALAATLLLCLIVIWRIPGERGLLFVVAGSGAFYAGAILLLGFVIPLFANRIFLPLLLPVTVMLAVGLADARSAVLRWGAALVLLISALGSSLNTLRLAQRYDNPARGLALADERGFAGAPVLTCSIFAAMATYLADSDRAIYQSRQDGVVRFNREYAGLMKHGLRWILLEPIASFSAVAPGVRDRAREIAAAPQLVVISEPCNHGYREMAKSQLAAQGFDLQESISLANSARPKVIKQTQTVVDLYRRAP